MIIIIAAVSENNALGKDNDLVWHLPDDFKRFKKLTSGHYIIMGRKTFESFPNPLPNRTHVIVTRQKNYTPEGCLIANTLQDAIQLCPANENIFIIGGGEIYKQSMVFADVLEITRVHHTFEADTFFPEIDSTVWELVSEEFHPTDDRHKHSFSYQTYNRKQKKHL